MRRLIRGIMAGVSSVTRISIWGQKCAGTSKLPLLALPCARSTAAFDAFLVESRPDCFAASGK